jgi:HrpA-like RNA helicase
MGGERKRLCKDFGKYEDCKGEIIISERVLELMVEKGESEPERCENCQKKHRADKRETRQSYFSQAMIAYGRSAKANHVSSAYTSHGDRKEKREFIAPDTVGMRIRITDSHIRELYEKLYDNQVVILASPTGTGKSVYVLYRLLEAPADYAGNFVKMLIHQGQVIQTQPLTCATGRIAETVSKKELGESGVRQMGIMGIRHQGREDYSRFNLGVVVTDGSLKNWLRNSSLGQYSLIMVDEAHKRSVNIDNLLNMLKEQLPYYPHLKVIIASATINLKEFNDSFASQGIRTATMDLSETLEEQINYKLHYLNGKPVPDCDCWACKNPKFSGNFLKFDGVSPQEADLPELVSSLVVEILNNTDKGGVLAFLTGESVIKKTGDLLTTKMARYPKLKGIPVSQVFSRLGAKKVEELFKLNPNPNNRRVLLTTDIAETSHTLDGVVYVIESGWIKQTKWDPNDMTSVLPTIRHSQAGCRQRFGRVGRTEGGYVYCLYTENEFVKEFQEQTTPEIFRSPIDDTILTAKAAGIQKSLKFIGSPDDASVFEMEMKRAAKAVEAQGFVDKQGNITDEGLDVFHVNLSPDRKALLDKADEQACLWEMLTFLCMTRTDTNGARSGAEAYNQENGLLVWDLRWNAATKMRVQKIHKALGAGCADDLDFALKLAWFYQDNVAKGTVEQWLEQNFLNGNVFEDVFQNREKISEIYLTKAEGRKKVLDLGLAKKVRLILSIACAGNTVKLEMLQGQLIYRFLAGGKELYGIVPETCAGRWKSGGMALLLTSIKKNGVFDGKPKPGSFACSIIRLESVDTITDSEFFVDQNVLVDSKVSLVQEGESFFIQDVIEAPSQISIIYYEKNLDFSMTMDDYLRPKYTRPIIFNSKEAKGRFGMIQGRIPALWVGRQSSEGRIIGWERKGDRLCAIVNSIDVFDIRKKICLTKKAMLTIVKVNKEIHDPKGWVSARSDEGIEFAIESNDLSLTFLDRGLRSLEGTRLELDVKNEKLGGVLEFTNLRNNLEAMNLIKTEIIRNGRAMLTGVIDKISPQYHKVFVAVIKPNGSICSFTIPVYSEDVLKSFCVGDKASLEIFLREGNREEGDCFINCPIDEKDDYIIESLPQKEGWKYDPESQRLYFPFFSTSSQLVNSEIDEEDKEEIVKQSWLRGFKALIRN